jgi:hypothetical protein
MAKRRKRSSNKSFRMKRTKRGLNKSFGMKRTKRRSNKSFRMKRTKRRLNKSFMMGGYSGNFCELCKKLHLNDDSVNYMDINRLDGDGIIGLPVKDLCKLLYYLGEEEHVIQAEEKDKVEIIEQYRDKIENIDKKIYTKYSYLDGPKGIGYYKKSKIHYCPTVMEFEMGVAEEPAEEPAAFTEYAEGAEREEVSAETGDIGERGKKIAFLDSNLAHIQEYETEGKLRARKRGDEMKQKKIKKLLSRYQKDHATFLTIASVTEGFNAELLERIKSEIRNSDNYSNISFLKKNCKILHDELLSLEPKQKIKIDKIKEYFAEDPSSVEIDGRVGEEATFSIKKQGGEEILTLRMIDVIDDHILWLISNTDEDDEDDEDD